MRLSIRVKFLVVMSSLLCVCLAFYLLMSIAVFKTDKTQLVYDLNKSQVTNLASEVETSLKGISDSLQLFAQLPDSMKKKMIENFFSDESDVVGLSIYNINSEKPFQSYVFQEYFDTYGLQKESFFENQKINQVRLKSILEKGESIWNASIENAPPMIGYGKLVIALDEQQRPMYQWVLVSYLRLDSLLKSVSLLSLSDIKISNNDGEILVQRDAANLYKKPNITETPLFKKAQESAVRVSVAHVEMGDGGWLSAFAKAFNGKVLVTANAPENKVFQVVQSLTVRTLLFGSIVLTLVMLVAFLMSKSLTENIAILAKRMVGVSQGDLETHIHLKGQDETVSLGNAFNKMIFDLKKSRDELEVMNKELDQKVKDRTRELEVQNQKVVEAQEALLRTTRLASMGEVAGRTAHEVLNPLTSLLTRAGLTQKRVELNYQEPLELLDEIEKAWQDDYQDGGFEQLLENWKSASSIDPSKNLFLEDVGNLVQIKETLKQQSFEIAKDMKFIKEEGDRIGKIIHSMRRLGNMNSEVRLQTVHNLLNDSAYIMADLFDQQRFKIEKQFNAEVDNTKVDRDEFIQSVTNLMRNSLQSMVEMKKQDAEYKGVLCLRTYIESEKLCIEVIDNGVGIDQAHREQLFSTNFTTKSSDEGTGLGLSISRRFIRNYDGDIYLVESLPKQRTVFRIELPLIEEQTGKAVA